MKNKITQIVTFAAITGLALTVWGGDDIDQSDFPQITAQPIDQAIPIGGNAVLTAQAVNADGYQWWRNGVALVGQTNSSLILVDVGTNDVGLYACQAIKADEAVPTRAASLNVVAPLANGDITLYGTPVLSGGSQGDCPGSYAGYVSYTKTVSQGWGWAPSTNTTIHTATDTTRSDTKVYYTGKFSDVGCDATTVTVPHPAPSPKYRFTIFFPDSVPTSSYPITLTGFDP